MNIDTITENYYFRRFLAFLIDFSFLGAVAFLSIYLIAFIHNNILFTIWNVFLVSLAFLYEPFFLSRYNTTIGKVIMKLQVCNEFSQGISFERGVKRQFFKVLSLVLLGVGLVPMFFNKQHQTFYDMYTKTMVTPVEEKNIIGREKRFKANFSLSATSIKSEVNNQLNSKEKAPSRVERAKKPTTRIERRRNRT